MVFVVNNQTAKMKVPNDIFDLVIIGGGINGAGIAADAAGRGLKVFLAEKNDLASGTSSNSSKLIHGGLRYLENFELSMVKKALNEREVLLKAAPHIIKPLTFHLPYLPHLRPAWLIKIGLFLYDNLAKRCSLPKSASIRFYPDGPLNNDITKGFAYSDGWVDDARLVVLNAIAAQEHGASINTQTECVAAKHHGQLWSITLKPQNGAEYTIKSKTLVNAAGPWVSQVFEKAIKTATQHKVRLVKGSHIVVPKLHNEEHAYILQNKDKRIVFAIPYENEFSLIGTTDVEFEQDPAKAEIEQQEIDYLIEISNAHFKRQISANDIKHCFSGVRALIDCQSAQAQQASRDYLLELEHNEQQPPLLSVIGGKLTTYRILAEEVLAKLQPFLPQMGDSWTADARLPGGHFSSKSALYNKLTHHYPWLWHSQMRRYIDSYGTNTYQVLQDIKHKSQLGIHFGADLYQCEVDYLVKNEWARTVDDIIWRRTKTGLHLNQTQIAKLERYLNTRRRPEAA